MPASSSGLLQSGKAASSGLAAPLLGGHGNSRASSPGSLSVRTLSPGHKQGNPIILDEISIIGDDFIINSKYKLQYKRRNIRSIIGEISIIVSIS
jgi:hypothetical protein